MSDPLISVILVCRNPGPQLHTALESIWAQAGADYEIVLVDGASDDGTRDWLETNRTRFGTLISEPDNGIYNAMNKGVAAAHGIWILFLGADDQLFNGALAEITPKLVRSQAGVVGGEAVYDNGRIYPLRDPGSGIRRNFAHHQATFYRREMFAKHGDFQCGLRIAADYEFNLRLAKNKIRFEPLNLRIAACGSGGLSDSGIWPVYREEIRVRHFHFPGWQCWLWDLASIVRFVRKKILRLLQSHG